LTESDDARTGIVFDDYDLIYNNRKTIKIEVASEGDGAFAVVDIDTYWRHKVTERIFLGKEVFARFIQRCQMEAGKLSSRQAHCLVLLGLMKKNNSSIGYHL